MSESIIADFVGEFNSEVMALDEPVSGRILLSQKRLVLAAKQNDKLTIPLSAVFDVAVGHVPPEMGDFFDSTVTVAFDHCDSRHVAVIEADDEKISKFSTVLFKAILNGTKTTVKERSRVGGKVTDEPFTPAKLFLESGVVEFRKPDGAFSVSLKTVTDFQRSEWEVDGATQPAVTFRHMKEGTAITTEAGLDSARKLSILGRFIKLAYNELMEEIEDIDLTEDKKEIVVAIYSTGEKEGLPLANIVSAESSEVTMLLKELQQNGLVQDSADGPTLTPMGEVVASRHLEDVND
jgi:helix-turn-helix protein